MKKIFFLSSIVLAVACNSGDTESGKAADSAVNAQPDASMNDNPMRTMDTSKNLMEDTLKANNDTMKKGSASH